MGSDEGLRCHFWREGHRAALTGWGEVSMLQIVWRNPNKVVRTRVSVERIGRHDSVTGHLHAIYRTRGALGSPEVEYEIAVSPREPVCVA